MSNIRCSREYFVKGWRHLFSCIGDSFSCYKNPTVERIKKKIFGHYEEWEYRGPAMTYFEKGGNIEDAIDFVLKMAKISVEDGVFD
jgi:hypothetical protein